MTTPDFERLRLDLDVATAKQAAKERAAAEEAERQAAINDEQFAAMGPGMGFTLYGPAKPKSPR